MVLDDDLYRAVKVAAADRGVTVTSMVEDALRLLLAQSSTDGIVEVELPVSRQLTWVRPGVEIDDGRALRALLDPERDSRALS